MKYPAECYTPKHRRSFNFAHSFRGTLLSAAKAKSVNHVPGMKMRPVSQERHKQEQLFGSGSGKEPAREGRRVRFNDGSEIEARNTRELEEKRDELLALVPHEDAATKCALL